jgi:hypothetical protein
LIVALFAVAGRVETAQSALLLAHALAEAPTALVRALHPADARLPAPALPPSIGLIEIVSRSVPETSVLVHEAIATALLDERTVVLDLPADCIADRAIRSRIDLGLVPVGPSPLDEGFAKAALANENRDPEFVPESGPLAPLWLLGCGRAGGAPAALRFRETMKKGARPGASPRTFPIALPALGREDALSLLGPRPSPRASREAALMLSAVRAIRARPLAASADIDDSFDAAMGHGAGEDLRDTADRLRDLADELRAIEAGLKPTAEDLAHAPVLDEWEPSFRPVRVLNGRARRHPSIRSGRRIRTSDVFATGPGWARTLSRYYVLGTPAGSKRTAH